MPRPETAAFSSDWPSFTVSQPTDRTCRFSPLVTTAAQFGFRLGYHGDVVPNTARVKAGFDPAAFGAGFDHVLAALGAHLGLVLAAALGGAVLLAHRSTRQRAACSKACE